jgi:hypothetical protein
MINDKNDGMTPIFGGNPIASLFRDLNKGFQPKIRNFNSQH